MKKFVFIITLLLFIPLTTHAKVYEHPTYNFSFEYPDDWIDITDKEKIPFYFAIGKIAKSNSNNISSKDSFSFVGFLVSYNKHAPNTISDLSFHEQQQLITTLKNDFVKQSKDCQFTSTEIFMANDIPYILIKYHSINRSISGWYVYFVKNNLQHSIVFYAENSTRYFESDWLQILDSYTKNL